MKRAKRPSLINVFEKPRNDYSAYWQIARPMPDPEGSGKWAWKAEILSYAPVAWLYDGQRHETRPNVPPPVYPPDLPPGLPAGARLGSMPQLKPLVDVIAPLAATVPLTPASTVADLAAARIKAVEKVWETQPKPVHLLEAAADVADSEDDARLAAQRWVRDNIEKYRRPKPLRDYTDREIDRFVALFDDSRELRVRTPGGAPARDFATIDKIRGLLKVRGIRLYTLDGKPESESPISYEGPTVWKREQSA